MLHKNVMKYSTMTLGSPQATSLTLILSGVELKDFLFIYELNTF